MYAGLVFAIFDIPTLEVRMAGSHHLNRRDFIKLTTAAVGSVIGAVIGLPAIAYMVDPAFKSGGKDAWVPLGKMETFETGKPIPASFTRSTVNGWEKTVNSYGVFVIKRSETEALVLSNKCTHLGCHVNWNADKGEYICPCHDAQFGANGEVLGGPPPRPLDQYSGDQVKIEDGTLFIHFLGG
jgi:menaquinol-cytochrome c reductase iron-sulfur subunit